MHEMPRAYAQRFTVFEHSNVSFLVPFYFLLYLRSELFFCSYVWFVCITCKHFIFVFKLNIFGNSNQLTFLAYSFLAYFFGPK